MKARDELDLGYVVSVITIADKVLATNRFVTGVGGKELSSPELSTQESHLRLSCPKSRWVLPHAGRAIHESDLQFLRD